MCRFLLIKSKQEINAHALLESFADMAEESRTAEGDRQGDGWGIAWRKKDKWQIYKSLKPIWEDRKKFAEVSHSDTFAVHARSASFANQVGTLEYNQPFINDEVCFVFNGVLKGVKLSRPVPGKIGAQKIFHLLREELKITPPKKSLQKLDLLLRNNAQEIGGLNIGVIYNNQLFALCDFGRDSDYFSIRYSQNEDISLVCSAELPGYNWQTMNKGDIIAV